MTRSKCFLQLALALLFVTLSGTLMAFEPDEGFVSLFNGKDLTGWNRKGGTSTYKVEDGAIVGRCNPESKKKNTFLCTDKLYGNFILKFQFKMLDSINSGVQFRSNLKSDGDGGRVFGYQAEIDPDKKNYTGRIYDEGRRGHKLNRVWLDDTTTPETLAAMHAAFKKGEWNDYEIQCVGPSIRTWINGVPVANIMDAVEMVGFIGLQVHVAPKGSVAWRNIQIKDLGISKWEPFFIVKDGKMALDKAHFILPNEWTFDEEGKFLRGNHCKAEKRDGLVVSDNEYDDFAVRVSYQISGGNSGLYFRGNESDVVWTFRGFQNEIATGDSIDHTSGIWHTSGKDKAGNMIKGRGWLARNDEFVAKCRKSEGWNTITTIAYGRQITNFLNDHKTVSFTDELFDQPSGKVGLQLHGGNDLEMRFKDFEILPITAEMKKLIER